MTREETHFFKVHKRVESIGVFFFCKSEEHKSVDCDKIKGVADRIGYLSDNKLCFNCTGTMGIVQLTKRVIRGCNGCKKFQVNAFSNPPAGKLPTDRTQGSAPFKVIGLDFAGLIGYKLKTKKEGKPYILLFACSLTRAVHLELLPNQTAEVHQATENGSSQGQATQERFIQITGELLLPHQSG